MIWHCCDEGIKEYEKRGNEMLKALKIPVQQYSSNYNAGQFSYFSFIFSKIAYTLHARNATNLFSFLDRKFQIACCKFHLLKIFDLYTKHNFCK